MTTKSVPLLQPEHGFFRKNGPKHGPVQDRYPIENMLVVPVCLNGRCYSSECADVLLYLKNEGDDPFSLLAFRRDFVNEIYLKYSKEGRSSSSHIGM